MRKLFLASLIFIFFAVTLMLFQMTSCKKADAQTANTYPIQGLWIGTYTVNGDPNHVSQYYSFVVKPDGTMIQDGKDGNQQAISIGTWSLTGTSFSCHFTSIYGVSGVGVIEDATATWDNSGKLNAGVWSNPPPGTGSGTFTMSRVN
jgi:hypothetical protein